MTGSLAEQAKFTGITDAMHAILMQHGDRFANAIDGPTDITEYIAIVATITAYARRRRRLGKIPRG
jgi:hypothetical protein